MAEPWNYCYDHEFHYPEQPIKRDEYITYAQANANYFYQLSLWWWNVYNSYNQSWDVSKLSDQNCECAERNMTFGCGCDWKPKNLCETCPQKGDSCKDCPDHEVSSSSSHCQEFHVGNSQSSGCPYGIYCTYNNKYVNGHKDLDYDYKGAYKNGDDHDNGSSDDDDDDDDNDDDDNGDDSDNDGNMDVDESFRKFLEQSEKHRQEREERKQEILKEKDEYIEVGSIYLNTTTCAPTEQPGVKRKEEMNVLYGKHSSLIMSLEASLQLNYNKNCDIRRPVFWPSIPLKF